MNTDDKKINITLPSVVVSPARKRRLKIALLEYHENRSSIHSFKMFINDLIKNMTIGKKSTALATLSLFALVLGAGIFGPTASDVAQAEATTTIKRAFARFTDLSDDEKAELQTRFQDRVHFKESQDRPFLGMNEMTEEEREKKHEEMKASLADSLAEAQSASDLEVVAADQMPVEGFFGKAGRAFGFKMMKNDLDNLENLPQEIQNKIKEREEAREEMEPVKFLKYTNSDGQKIYLGLNSSDEPVMKFVEGENPPFPGEGRGKGPGYRAQQEQAE